MFMVCSFHSSCVSGIGCFCNYSVGFSSIRNPAHCFLIPYSLDLYGILNCRYVRFLSSLTTIDHFKDSFKTFASLGIL